MTANDRFFQRRQPAAVLKHSVLSEYCAVFTSMTGSAKFGPTVWIIDGYAGPGTYDGDAEGVGAVDGSPLVAMRSARQWRTRASPRDLRGVFIEADPVQAAALRANLAPFQQDGLTAVVLEGTVEEHLLAAWSGVGEAPVVTFLDPFGVALPCDTMTRVLMDPRRRAPSEVLVNVNVEAVRRLGGWLAYRDGEVVPAEDRFRRGVERVDRFFGDPSWRRLFFEARTSDAGTAASAAEVVVAQYRTRVGQLTGYRSMSVPIRRGPNQPALFHLTLFYRHPAAGYKFADAAARATKKWRETYWAQYWDRKFDNTPTLFEAEDIAAMTQAEAQRREAGLADQWVNSICNNISALVARSQQVRVADHVVEILGDTLSFAGERHIRKAWDALANQGVVRARDTTKKYLHTLDIVAKR